MSDNLTNSTGESVYYVSEERYLVPAGALFWEPFSICVDDRYFI
jgi:hypothetical protein